MNLVRERVCQRKDEAGGQNNDDENRSADSLSTTLHSPTRTHNTDGSTENRNGDQHNEHSPAANNTRSFTKSASISASKCIVVGGTDTEVIIYQLIYQDATFAILGVC